MVSDLAMYFDMWLRDPTHRNVCQWHCDFVLVVRIEFRNGAGRGACPLWIISGRMAMPQTLSAHGQQEDGIGPLTGR
jgi:hypothetical protein